jgi:hypothetical protein
LTVAAYAEEFSWWQVQIKQKPETPSHVSSPPLRHSRRPGPRTTIWLGVTELLLVGVIFYRLYVLGQPDEQIRDFQAVLAISLFGYMGLQLFLGGIMPIPTWKGAVLFYVILASAISRRTGQTHGYPPSSARRYSLLRTWSLPASGTGGSNARLSA